MFSSRFMILIILYACNDVVYAENTAYARISSLGNNVIAGCGNIVSPLFNPAVLRETKILSSSYSQAKTSVDSLSFQITTVTPLISGNFGAGIGWKANVSRDQIQTELVRDSNGQIIVDPVTGLPMTRILGFFTRNANQVNIAVGCRLPIISLGLAEKYYRTKFGSRDGEGFGTDVAIQADITKQVKFGYVIYDVGESNIDYEGADYDESIPMSYSTSMLFEMELWKGCEVGIEPGMTRISKTGENESFTCGMEFSYRECLFLRGGMNKDRLSFGVGLKAHPEKVFKEIGVDYGYLGRMENGFPSRVSLNVGW